MFCYNYNLLNHCLIKYEVLFLSCSVCHCWQVICIGFFFAVDSPQSCSVPYCRIPATCNWPHFQIAICNVGFFREKFEDTKDVIKSRKLKKDRQHNDTWVFQHSVTYDKMSGPKVFLLQSLLNKTCAFRNMSLPTIVLNQSWFIRPFDLLIDKLSYFYIAISNNYR